MEKLSKQVHNPLQACSLSFKFLQASTVLSSAFSIPCTPAVLKNYNHKRMEKAIRG